MIRYKRESNVEKKKKHILKVEFLYLLYVELSYKDFVKDVKEN